MGESWASAGGSGEIQFWGVTKASGVYSHKIQVFSHPHLEYLHKSSPHELGLQLSQLPPASQSVAGCAEQALGSV